MRRFTFPIGLRPVAPTNSIRLGHFMWASRHIPDRFEHLVRYAGWYSNRSRGKRAAANADPEKVIVECRSSEARRARSTWARLIQKVYEVDPLECPRCKCAMKVIALIEDSSEAQAQSRTRS